MYKAIVVSNQDPLYYGRIRIKCGQLWGEHIVKWAEPCFPIDRIQLPNKGEVVWINLDNKDKDRPVWIGVLYTREQYIQRLIPEEVQ
jgi:hypothetical protein